MLRLLQGATLVGVAVLAAGAVSHAWCSWRTSATYGLLAPSTSY